MIIKENNYEDIKSSHKPFSADDYIKINKDDNHAIISLSVTSSIKFAEDSKEMNIIKCLILMTYLSEVLEVRQYISLITKSYGTFNIKKEEGLDNITFTLIANPTDQIGKKNHVIVQLNELLKQIFIVENPSYESYKVIIEKNAFIINGNEFNVNGLDKQSLAALKDMKKGTKEKIMKVFKEILSGTEIKHSDKFSPLHASMIVKKKKLPQPFFEKGYVSQIKNNENFVTGFFVKNSMKFTKDSKEMNIIKCLILMNCISEMKNINDINIYGKFGTESIDNESIVKFGTESIDNESIVKFSLDSDMSNDKNDHVIVQLDSLLKIVFKDLKNESYTSYKSTIKEIADKIKNSSLQSDEKFNIGIDTHNKMLIKLESSIEYNEKNNTFILSDDLISDSHDDKIKKDNTFRDSVIGIVLVSVIVGITYFFMTKEEFKNDDETENNENNIKRN